MGQGTSDSILGVIWITVWIVWILEFFQGFFIIGRWGYFPHMCVGELSCLDEGTLPWWRSALSECSC